MYLGAKITHFSEPTAKVVRKVFFWVKNTFITLTFRKNCPNAKNIVTICQFFVFLPFLKSKFWANCETQFMTMD